MLFETKKMIAGVGFKPNHVWAPCCKTWQKFEIETLRCGKNLKLKKMFGSWIVPLVGHHVVDESKVAQDIGRHVVNEL